MKKPTGPVWDNKYGKPLRCEDCGKPRMRGTKLCPKCNGEIVMRSMCGTGQNRVVSEQQ